MPTLTLQNGTVLNLAYGLFSTGDSDVVYYLGPQGLRAFNNKVQPDTSKPATYLIDQSKLPKFGAGDILEIAKIVGGPNVDLNKPSGGYLSAENISADKLQELASTPVIGPDLKAGAFIPNFEGQVAYNTDVVGGDAGAKNPAIADGQSNISNSVIASLPTLTPGTKSDDVTKLQNWLIQNGYPIPSGATGYYGEQTKAAVTAWQTSAGIDTKGNPGYFGPVSKSYLSSNPTSSSTPASSAVANTTQGASGSSLLSTPQDVLFKDSDAYKALSPEMQEFIDLGFNLISFGGEEEAKMFSNAIEQAKGVADPYFKSMLALANAEVLLKIADQTQDFEFKSKAVQSARDQLMEDVSRNKEFLTLEQQADIAREIKGYDNDLLDIADQAAEKGLTFGTGARSRALAESRRTAQFEDVVQSNQRLHNFRIQELELKAARGDEEAKAELSNLQAKQGFGLQDIGLAAEKVLGSANLPGVTGYTPVGGVTGTIEEQKKKSILSDVSGFLELQKGFI